MNRLPGILVLWALAACAVPLHEGEEEYTIALREKYAYPERAAARFERARDRLAEAVSTVPLSDAEEFHALTMMARCYLELERYPRYAEYRDRAARLFTEMGRPIQVRADTYVLRFILAGFKEEEAAAALKQVAGADLRRASWLRVRALETTSDAIDEYLSARETTADVRLRAYADLQITRLRCEKVAVLRRRAKWEGGSFLEEAEALIRDTLILCRPYTSVEMHYYRDDFIGYSRRLEEERATVVQMRNR